MPVLSSGNLTGLLVSDKHRSNRAFPSLLSKEKAVVYLYLINLGHDPSLICVLVIHTYTKRYFTLSVTLWIYGTMWIIPIYI